MNGVCYSASFATCIDRLWCGPDTELTTVRGFRSARIALAFSIASVMSPSSSEV
jgi:hypothetical protein